MLMTLPSTFCHCKRQSTTLKHDRAFLCLERRFCRYPSPSMQGFLRQSPLMESSRHQDNRPHQRHYQQTSADGLPEKHNVKFLIILQSQILLSLISASRYPQRSPTFKPHPLLPTSDEGDMETALVLRSVRNKPKKRRKP